MKPRCQGVCGVSLSRYAVFGHRAERERRARRAWRNQHQRRGAILVAAVVCTAIAAALVASMLQTALRSRQALQTERLVRQTDLLAEAGLIRAATQLRFDGGYVGEEWQLESAQIVDEGPATIVIEVVRTRGELAGRAAARAVPLPDAEFPWLVVTARYPSDALHPVQRSRVFALPVSTPAEED